MYRVIWEVAFLVTGVESVTRIAVRAKTGQSPNSASMLGQRRRQWVNIKTALGECHVFDDVLAQIYSRPSVGLVWGQPRGRLTGIEPAMGCDAGPTLNQYWMGRPTSCVRGTS